MAKRKLSLQQQRRIRARQQSGGSAATSPASVDSLGPEQAGVVATRFGKKADIHKPDFGPGDPAVRCHIRATVNDLVTGDKVMWRQSDSGCVVERVLPRQTLLCRPDNRGQLRPVAANVNRIAIVIAPRPEPHANLIDRYLVAAENQGIAPMLLVNKADMGDPDGQIETLLSRYQALGYDVLRVSAANGDGMNTLRDYLKPLVTILAGQSGVGKSSILNQLHPEAAAAVGTLSEQVAKGRHTTTAATLYRLPDGGYLVDSPGIREFGLWHMDVREVANGFCDFRPYLGSCRFRDCLHGNEPGCAITEAVAKGKISRERYLSYRHIVRDLSIR